MREMEVENQEEQLSRWDGYVDWRNRPAQRSRHGGMLAASFVLVVEILENLAFLANASNLVMYLSKYMHFSPSKSANNVTNFMGTAFLLALLGGFLSDAFFTTYHIYLISALIEFLGLIVLAVQARTPSLQPPKTCDLSNPNIRCEEVSGAKEAMLFLGLYLVALGVGGIKGSLPTHGAEQFDESTPNGRKRRSTFFNYFVFCLSTGGLIAVTFVVWVEDNKGWQWGFWISTLSIFLSIPVFLAGSALYRNKISDGSPLTTILKVLVAATFNKSKSTSFCNAVASMGTTPGSPASNSTVASTTQQQQEEQKQDPTKTVECMNSSTQQTQSLRFLNRAVSNKPAHPSLQCTINQVEEVKIVLKVLPIFACTIILNTCLAQLSTFSVEQAATMDTKIGSLKVPPASLPVFPVLFIMFLAPIYDHFIIPFARKLTKSEIGITHLQRIGIGLVLSVIAMGVAALVEIKRKRVATKNSLLESTEPLPITFLWIGFQYLFLGSADLFTLAGLLEFFFTEAPSSMRSLATSLSWASLAVGYYLSTAIVSIVNSVSGTSGHTPWLKGSNINHYHLDRFYWLMCVLSLLNYLHYIFWSIKYEYRSSTTIVHK